MGYCIGEIFVWIEHVQTYNQIIQQAPVHPEELLSNASYSWTSTQYDGEWFFFENTCSLIYITNEYSLQDADGTVLVFWDGGNGASYQYRRNEGQIELWMVTIDDRQYKIQR